MGSLIGGLMVTPPKPRPAQPVRLQVLSPDGVTPLADPELSVTIGGVPATARTMQYRSPGEYTVRAVASHDGVSETETATVIVEGKPIAFKRAALLEPETALLAVRQTLDKPYELRFWLGDVGKPPAPDPRPRGGRPRSQIEPAPDVGPGSTPLADVVEAVQDDETVRYMWDFGDGTTAITHSPTVTHDYFETLDHVGGIGRFDVRCWIPGQPVDVTRTLVLHSAYGVCRERGTIVLHTDQDVHAHKKLWWLRGDLTVYNVEDQDIVLDRRALVPLSEDPDDLATPAKAVKLHSPIRLPANSTTLLVVNPWLGVDVPVHTPGFTVYFGGHAADGTKVRVSAVFEVPMAERGLEPLGPKIPKKIPPVWPWEKVLKGVRETVNKPDALVAPEHFSIDRATGTMSVRIPAHGARRPGADVRAQIGRLLAPAQAALRQVAVDAGVKRLVVSERIELAPVAGPGEGAGDLGAGSVKTNGAKLPDLTELKPKPGIVAEGQICDPDNIPPEDADLAEDAQLVCQLSGEEGEFLMPGRFMNARKGDIVLSPGGTGLIGGLLARVQPPQRFSHSGLMTRNFDEITHSTASEERIKAYPMDGGDVTDGFEPHAVKYMWPGVVAQEVEAAVNGEQFPDPEDGTQYSISSFSPHQVGATYADKFEIVFPVVVKPDPLLETPAIREELHALASAARKGAGRPDVNSKSHYRLYCYTDPAITFSDTGPTEGWAAGTFPTVCSSFIWRELRLRNARLEAAADIVQPGDLEQKDVDAGAEVRPLTRDGLYTYTAEERLTAGQWLWDRIDEDAFTKAGWFIEAWTDAADDVANQLVNTFANDDAEEGKDHEDWKDTAAADAVSPDNILFWDGPENGGLYGFVEPLSYREPRVETYPLSRWKKVLVRGAITGVVRRNGKPVAGATVWAYDGAKGSDVTDADGAYRLDDVGFGPYLLKTWKSVDGVHWSTQRKVDHQKETTVADFDLEPPAGVFRLVELFYDFYGNDDEDVVSDERCDPPSELVALELGPDRLTNSHTVHYQWGGEVVVEYEITVRLLAGNSVDVEVIGRLWEGSDYDKDADELGETAIVNFTVPVDGTKAVTCKVRNVLDDELDTYGVLDLSAHNGQNNN